MQNKVNTHLKENVAVVDEYDRQIWEMLTNVPLVSKPIAIASAFLNLLIPGFGTVLAAC